MPRGVTSGSDERVHARSLFFLPRRFFLRACATPRIVVFMKTTRFDRRTLTTLHNMGPRGVTLRVRSPLGDALVEQGYATCDGLHYTITPAGEARLLDRSDVSSVEEAAIARSAMRAHERE